MNSVGKTMQMLIPPVRPPAITERKPRLLDVDVESFGPSGIVTDWVLGDWVRDIVEVKESIKTTRMFKVR